jgi:hypothetical protein
MNEPPGARVRVTLTDRSRRVIVRRQHFPLHPGRLRGVHSSRSYSLCCRLPTYTLPHFASRQERITTTKKGSITSVQAVYIPADDWTDPAPATTFAHLDATTVLSRSIAELGIYPAVDPLDSKSRMLDPRIVRFFRRQTGDGITIGHDCDNQYLTCLQGAVFTQRRGVLYEKHRQEQRCIRDYLHDYLYARSTDIVPNNSQIPRSEGPARIGWPAARRPNLL